MTNDESAELLTAGLEAISRQEYREAAEAFRRSAELGNAPAQYNLGRLYLRGLGVEASEFDARVWFERAAGQNLPIAIRDIGLLFEEGLAGLRKDPKQAFEHYWRAAELGDAVSKYCIGAMYYHGKGVRRDCSEAVKWYHLAAKDGVVMAQCDLAIELMNGRYVGRDAARAYFWMMLAAESGDATSKANLKIFEKQASDEDIAQAHVYRLPLLLNGTFHPDV